jgi:maltooligosyltrehalose trehalohydrolase
MTEINTLKRNLGVVLSNGSSTVNIWAPFAKKVNLELSHTALDLLPGEFGYWTLETDQLKAGVNYHISIDGEKFPDIASLSQPDGVNGPSQIVDLQAYSWTDTEWGNLPLKDYIIYELHIGTFTPNGTFEELISKLDYLVDLGINAIEIMPIGQFSGARNWGYDGVYPFAVQFSYGGAAGLQKLIDSCHNKGLAVILDVVYNHLGPEGNYFSKFGPYFTEKYSTPWGDAINFDDAWSDGVRSYYLENVLMWFRDFHFDALRLDAVHAIKDFGARHFLEEVKILVDQLMKETGKTHYLIVESDLNDPKFIDSLQEKGYGMDAQWIDEFHHALRITAGGDKNGYYADFNGIQHLEKTFRDAYVYDGLYSPHRLKKFGRKAENNPGQQFIVFSQNHDQVGNRMLGERSSQLFSFEMQKLMAATVFCSPFIPMLFMGEEYGELNPFLYFVSHSDPALIKAVQKGRHDEFASFHAEGEAPDPQSEETFENSKLNWNLMETPKHQKMLNFYKALISLRKTNEILNKTNRQNLHVQSIVEKNCLIIERWEDDSKICCYFNFSNEQQTLNSIIEDLSYTKIFDTADPEWLGPESSPITLKEGMPVILQPQSLLIYSNKLKNV